MAGSHATPSQRRTLIWTLVGGSLGLASSIGSGVWVSQFHPIFGSIFERHPEMEPFGPARMGLIPIHVFVFGLVGIALGSALGAAFAMLFTGGAPPLDRPRGTVLREPPIVWPGQGQARPPEVARHAGARDEFSFLDGE